MLSFFIYLLMKCCSCLIDNICTVCLYFAQLNVRYLPVKWTKNVAMDSQGMPTDVRSVNVMIHVR